MAITITITADSVSDLLNQIKGIDLEFLNKSVEIQNKSVEKPKKHIKRSHSDYEKWTPEQDAILLDNFAKASSKQLLELLPGRNMNAIRLRHRRLAKNSEATPKTSVRKLSVLKKRKPEVIAKQKEKDQKLIEKYSEPEIPPPPPIIGQMVELKKGLKVELKPGQTIEGLKKKYGVE
jgi:hypothetical protein